MEEMLLHSDNTAAATAEIESIGGRVTLLLGADLLVAKVPKDFIAQKKNFASASAYIATSASPETLTYVQAYWMAREKKTKPPPPIQRWSEKTAPIVLPQPQEYPFPEEANSPYRKTLTGKIAVAAIIVSGPGDLAISDAEKIKIVSEVTAGLQFWTDVAPDSANLQFQLYDYFCPIDAKERKSCPSYSGCHNVFANPALEYLGYRTGRAGRNQLARSIKDESNADGAYLSYFSKYKQKHFAYAYSKGPLYMQYNNDGWGSNQIDRVFAHETGHVFYARDEYGNCGCNDKEYGEGACTARNGNCDECSGILTSCVMKSNTLNVCSYTKKHLGWCD
jgi:hypothetical protein